jgi:shikimate dehydrogenase
VTQNNLRERFILIGHPVGHSVSPTIHQRAYELLGRSGDYQLSDCPHRDDVLARIDEIRRGELTGANVTVPWKRVAFEAADEHHASARDVGVANVLARSESGRVVAYNTDALALGTELSQALSEAGLEPGTRAAGVILGAGGAALAAAVGLRLAGVTQVYATARRFDPALSQASWPGAGDFLRLDVKLLPWPGFNDAPLREVFKNCVAVVQASSAGMKGTTGGEALCNLIPWDSLSPAVAYDLVYNPPQTPFLARAKSEGLVCRGGLGMLVGQAAQAIEIWWGERPPLPPLMRAAQEQLGL